MSKSDDEEGIKFWIQCYKEKKEAEGECEQSGRVYALWKFYLKILMILSSLEMEEKNLILFHIYPHLLENLFLFKMINQYIEITYRKHCNFYYILFIIIVFLIYILTTKQL